MHGDGDEETGQDRGPHPSDIGKADTPNVAGSDVQQPEIAEGPTPGLEPGEQVERGPWRPPVSTDPPPDYGHPPEEDATAHPDTRHGGPDDETDDETDGDGPGGAGDGDRSAPSGGSHPSDPSGRGGGS